MKSKWMIGAAAAIALALLTLPTMLRRNGSVEALGPSAAGASCKGEGMANLNFTLKDMNGANMKLADLKGKVVLLNFWATWCAPCLMEIPEFVRVVRGTQEPGVRDRRCPDGRLGRPAEGIRLRAQDELSAGDQHTGARRRIRADLRFADVSDDRARWLGLQTPLRADVQGATGERAQAAPVVESIPEC